MWFLRSHHLIWNYTLHGVLRLHHTSKPNHYRALSINIMYIARPSFFPSVHPSVRSFFLFFSYGDKSDECVPEKNVGKPLLRNGHHQYTTLGSEHRSCASHRGCVLVIAAASLAGCFFAGREKKSSAVFNCYYENEISHCCVRVCTSILVSYLLLLLYYLIFCGDTKLFYFLFELMFRHRSRPTTW